MLKKFLFFLTLFFVSAIVSANHLLGGTITYKYVSSAADSITYAVEVKLYRECLDKKTDFDQTIKLGIYKYVNNIDLYKSEELMLTSKSAWAGSCFFSDYCVESGIYSKKITLKLVPYGYYLKYERCCRDDSYNLSYQSGMALLALISPAVYKNNSPQFPTDPKIRNNAGDTIIDFGATDLDGDSLVYSLATPMNGGSKGNANPNPAPRMIDTAFVKYNSGYGYLNPLESNGFISINKTTGKLTFNNPTSGHYFICIEVKEFRRGTLIGIHRRDYVLIFYYKPQNEEFTKIQLHRPEFATNMSVALSWDACPDNLENFKVEHREKSTNWEVIGITNNSDNFIDSISNSVMHYYRIKALVNTIEYVSNIDSAYLILTKTRTLEDITINLYPNPTKNYLHFKNPSVLSYAIYDIAGKLLLESKGINLSSETKIDVKSLNQGVYFIVLKTEQGLVTERFIKE